MKISPKEASAKVSPVYKTLETSILQMQLLMKDIELWKSSDTDVLTSLAERLYDATSVANESVGNLYHWIHQVTNTTPGLSRPMGF